ncbi:MAG TPA: hypothetical protein PLD95_04050 [bacterium]|jgi:hypothetical protein|nr:hypothetical protein [bacterium]
MRKNKILYDSLIQFRERNELGYPLVVYNGIECYIFDPEDSKPEDFIEIVKKSGDNFKLSEIKEKDKKLQPKYYNEFEFITINLSNLDYTKMYKSK